MNPNAYLAVAIQYLYAHRDGWNPDAGIGKTLVSSSMINRVAEDLGRTLIEVPVGFKWFVPGLRTGEIGFGGEESAGASFLALDGKHLDHRQGRHPARPAGQRDQGRHRQVPERAVRGADRQARRPGVRAGGRPGQPRAEGQAGQARSRPR